MDRRAWRVMRSGALLITISAVALAGCGGGGGSSGGITIPSSDSTKPELTFGAAATAPGGPDATVGVGQPDAAITLTTKTGSVNLLATAKDPESGIQSVQIWLETTETTCGTVCSGGNPDLPGNPRSESTEPQKQPGDTTSETSILADSLNLATEIHGSAPAGGTYTLRWRLWAIARNQLGGMVQSPTITVNYKEP